MKLTIAIPVYNGEQFLQKCVDSILDQTVSVQILILDDASTDRTGLIAQTLEMSNPCIEYIRYNKNTGNPDRLIGEAINLCKTPYFGWIGADDFYNENALFEFISNLESDPLIDYVFSDLATFGDLSLAPKGYGVFKDCSKQDYLEFFHKTLLPIIPMNGVWKTSYLKSCESNAWTEYPEAHNRSDVLNGLYHFSKNLKAKHISKKLISYRLDVSCGTQDIESRILSLKGLLMHYYAMIDLRDLDILHNCTRENLVKFALKNIESHINRYSTYLQFSASQGEIYFACMMYLESLNPKDFITTLEKRILESV